MELDVARCSRWQAKKHAGHLGGAWICGFDRWVWACAAPGWSWDAIANAARRKRDDLDEFMTGTRIGAYVGIDPTASSIHIGNLVPLMALFWLYVNGYRAVSLVCDETPRCNSHIINLTDTAWRRHCQGWRSFRTSFRSTQRGGAYPNGKNGQHALSAEEALGECRIACTDPRVSLGVGLASRARQ